MSSVKDGFIVKGVYQHVPIKGKYSKHLNEFMSHRDGQVCYVSRVAKLWLPWGISFIPCFDRDRAVFMDLHEAVMAMEYFRDSAVMSTIRIERVMATNACAKKLD